MSAGQLRSRIAALRSEATAVGARARNEARSMDAGEVFEIAGELQGGINSTEGARLVAAAHTASFETRLKTAGRSTPTKGVRCSLESGISQWAARRRVSPAADAGERFPRLLGRVVA